MININLLVEAVHDSHFGGVYTTVLVGAIPMVVMVIMASHFLTFVNRGPRLHSFLAVIDLKLDENKL